MPCRQTSAFATTGQPLGPDASLRAGKRRGALQNKPVWVAGPDSWEGTNPAPQAQRAARAAYGRLPLQRPRPQRMFTVKALRNDEAKSSCKAFRSRTLCKIREERRSMGHAGRLRGVPRGAEIVNKFAFHFYKSFILL